MAPAPPRQLRHAAARALVVAVLALCLLPHALSEAQAAVQGTDDWAGYLARLGTVSVNSQRLSQTLGPAFNYSFSLPEVQLRKGVAYTGANPRLRRVMRDLVTGKRPVRVAVLCAASPGMAVAARGEADWFSRLSRYLPAAFPHANVTLHVACPGGPQAAAALGGDVDAVFLEYMDGWEDKLDRNSRVRELEAVVRQVLALGRQPALVMMQGISSGSGTPQLGPQFPHTLEDLYLALAQYYDVQALSLRTAVYRLASFKKQEGFKWSDLMASSGSGAPGAAAHRAMADLAVWLLQQTAVDLMLRPFGRADKELLSEALPPPTGK